MRPDGWIDVERAPERDTGRSLGFYAYCGGVNLGLFVEVDKMMAFRVASIEHEVRMLTGYQFTAELRRREREIDARLGLDRR